MTAAEIAGDIELRAARGEAAVARLERRDALREVDVRAAELRAAADALERAAWTLRDRAGLGAEAGEAMQAALRARQAAGGDDEA